MSKRDTTEDEPDTAPDGADSGSTDDRNQPLPDRVRKRFGPAIDPDISLDPSAGTGSSTKRARPTAEPLSQKERIGRLEKLMPAEYRYKFVGEIGRGGMGAVLEVRDRDLNRRLAMKVIAGRGTSTSDGVPTDRGKVARFLEEAQITGQLNHPGIVPVHEIGMDARGRLFFTMRLVEGNDLKRVFAAIHGEATDDPDLAGWTLNRALGAVLRVCETMAFAHKNGVIHRDLKPSNIMVGGFGETYVMDWGLAKVMNREDTRNLRLRTGEDASGSFVHTDRAAEAGDDPDSPLVTMDGTIVGTPAYMSPEQAKGEVEKVGPRSDVYSMGAMLYHLLTGRAPYSEPDARTSPQVVLMRVIGGPPPRVHKLNSSVPAELCSICEKAMSYGRKGRYATMLELAEDLQAYLEGRVVRAHETGSIAEFKKWVERNKAFAAVILVAFVALVGTLGRIGYIQAQNNETLAIKNAELIEKELQAKRSAEEARSNAEVATQAQLAAEASDSASRRQGYLSNILAATSSLRLDETAVATRHLALADEEFAGWELDHLRLAADTSLDVWPTGYVTRQLVAWSPDGTLVANLMDGKGGTIELRDADGGTLLDELAGHSSAPTTLEFSPDSRWLVSASGDRSVRIWNTTTGRGTVLERDTSISELAFTPGGRQLVGGGLDNHLWLWDLDLTGERPTATVVRHPRDEGGALSAVAVDPDGRWVASGTEEGLVRLWDLAELRATTDADELDLIRPLESGLASVSSLAFAAGGELLAVTTNDGRVRVASTSRVASGLPNPFVNQQTLPGASATDVGFLPDGRVVLACNDGVVRVLSLADGSFSSIHGHAAPVTSVAVSGDGSKLITGAGDETLRLWSCYALLPTTLFAGHRENVRDVVFSPDGATLATASDDGTAWLWEASSGEVTHILRGHSAYVRSMGYSSDGELLATGSGDRTIRLWDAETGELFTIWEGHSKWVSDLAFSPDDRYLASASGDGTCRVWDVEEERELTVFEGHGSWIHCLTWNATGTRLLSGDSKGQVLEWDPFTGAIEASFELGEAAVASLVWGPGEHHFTAASMDHHLWVIDDAGQVTERVRAHDNAIATMTLSPDGRRLVTGDRGGELKVWDTADWESTMSLHTNETGLPAVYGRQIGASAFSPDGKRVAAARGLLVRVWETTPTAQRHEAMLAARRVIGLVDDLFNDLGLPSLVLDSLRENRDISGKLREAAINSVTAASRDPELLVSQAWELLDLEDADLEDHRNALALARMAMDLKPDEPAYRCAVAAACLRTGEHTRAQELLLELADEGWGTESEPHPEVQILLAMAEFHLGDSLGAANRLDALAPEMARPLWQRQAGDLFAEARALIASGD